MGQIVSWSVRDVRRLEAELDWLREDLKEWQRRSENQESAALHCFEENARLREALVWLRSNVRNFDPAVYELVIDTALKGSEQHG